MKSVRASVALCLVLGACASGAPEAPRTTDPAVAARPAPAADPASIVASIDLVTVSDDRVRVVVDPGPLSSAEVLFRLPRVVQGTYDISDFGSYVDDLTALAADGEAMSVERVDENTWRIPQATRLDRVTYYVNDTFDEETTRDDAPFSPSGTDIEPRIFVLNLHGFVGYFEGMTEESYEVRVTAPASVTRASALPLAAADTSADGTRITDVYRADRYFQVTDNPMLYGDFQTRSFEVGGILVDVGFYSATGAHDIDVVMPSMERMMAAQRRYLGDLSTTDRYAVFVFLSGNGPDQPTGFGALEHHTSTVVVLPDAIPADALNDNMVDIVSHEFFHIVSPLSVHSEDVAYFDYYAPTFSRHLWLYEGQTEYFASHFQVYEGLESPDAFYEKMAGKIDDARAYDDSMSFTVMSENIIDEPYASNYANVYQKGALIGMCNDVLIRSLSGGDRSLVDVMRELSAEYGVDTPFDDDTFVDVFTAKTYPEVGDFLRTHVVGTTPIDYDDCLDPVGLDVVTEDARSLLLFLSPQVPYIDANPSTNEIFFRDIPLNSTLEAMGVRGGDVLKSFNGTAYGLDTIAGLAQASVALTPDSDVTLVVERDGEEIELTGKMGNPTIPRSVIRPSDERTPEQIATWKAWLNQP